MTTILILEHDPAVRRLLELQVRRLGRKPVLWLGADPAEFDVALVEPAWHPAALFARRLSVERRQTPLVFVSVLEPRPETRALQPVAHLVKPVRLAELDRALSDAERRLL